ncbi:MAG: hypothetical protein ACMXYL_02570 [Candidatus Woesearchaeota archaeon]
MNKKTILLLVPIVLLLIVILMFLFQLCPPDGPWPHPPWCDPYDYTSLGPLVSNQIFLTRIDQQKIPMIRRDDLARQNAHALGWQGLAVENPGYRMGSRQLISTARSIGMPTISSMNIIYLIRVSDIGKEHTAAKDIMQNPITLAHLESAQGTVHGDYWRNILHPEYQDMLMEDIKTNIDLGADGIVFDDTGTGSAYNLVYRQGGSFDDYAVEGFRSYLQEHYDEHELIEHYGIRDAESFDIREYIISNGLTDSWNDNTIRTNRLSYDYERYLSIEYGRVIRNLTERAREYGISIGKDILISYNAAPLFMGNNYYALYDDADFLHGEHFWFDKEHVKGSVAVKLAEGLSKGTYVMLLEVKHDQGELPMTARNLYRYAFADTYSTGIGSLQIAYPEYWTMRGWDYVEGLSYDDSIIERYAGFLKANPHLFSLREDARIALVNSMPSSRLAYTPTDPTTHNYGMSHRHTITIIDMLLNLNIPFHSIISGNDISVPEIITLERLSDYDMIILPTVLSIREEEIEALIEYADKGGIVLQINQLGLYDTNWNIREEVNMAGRDNVENIGSGLWIYDDYGRDFEMGYLYTREGINILPQHQDHNNPHMNRLYNRIIEHIMLDFKVDAPKTINVRRYADNDRMVFHVVNYDYDHTSDTHNSSGPITIKLKMNNDYNNAIAYDIITNTTTELAIEYDNGMQTIILPSIESYGIIELS